MFGLNPMELMIVGTVAVLLFGSKLPSVARSLGKSLTEFKRGMQGIDDEIRQATRPTPTPKFHSIDDREEPTAPRFEPPPANEPALAEAAPDYDEAAQNGVAQDAVQNGASHDGANGSNEPASSEDSSSMQTATLPGSTGIHGGGAPATVAQATL